MGSRRSPHVIDVSGYPLIPYARNSKPKKGRKRISVEEQDFEIRDHCEEAGELLYDGPTIVDKDRHAGFDADEREGWDLVMKMIETCQYGGVVVRDADRAARDGWISEQLIRLVRTKGLKGFRVVSPIVTYDLSTQKGVSDFRAAIDAAEKELTMLRRRTSISIKRKAIAGEVTGGSPRVFGWRDKYTGTKEPAEAAAIAEAHQKILDDPEFDMNSLVDEWLDEGLVTTTGMVFAAKQLKEVLIRPSNAGLVTAGGRARGSFAEDPIVSEEEHKAVVAYFDSIKQGRPPRYDGRYMLSRLDVIKCPDCKSRMHGGRSNLPHKPAYVCSYNPTAPKRKGCRRSIKAAGVDEVVREKTLAWWKDPSRADRDHLFLLQTNEEQQKLQGQIEMVDARLEALTLKLELPPERYDRATRTLLDRRAELQSALERLQAPSVLESVTSDYIDQLWSSSIKSRRKMIKAAIKTIWVFPHIYRKGTQNGFQPDRLAFEYW